MLSAEWLTRKLNIVSGGLIPQAWLCSFQAGLRGRRGERTMGRQARWPGERGSPYASASHHLLRPLLPAQWPSSFLLLPSNFYVPTVEQETII